MKRGVCGAPHFCFLWFDSPFIVFFEISDGSESSDSLNVPRIQFRVFCVFVIREVV